MEKLSRYAVGHIPQRFGHSRRTAWTHGIRASSVIAEASPKSNPQRRVDRARSLRRVPPQSGQTSCFEKFFYALHTLVVLDLRQCIFYGIHGIVIGKVQLAGLVAALRLMKKCAF